MKSRNAAIIGGTLIGLGIGAAWARRRRVKYSFEGRVVLITGGSRGLGLVMARQLAREGARLALIARSGDQLQRAADELTASGGEVVPLVCDASKQGEVDEATRRVIERYGQVDVLINNAGIVQVGPMDHMALSDFEDALATHLYAPLYWTLAVLPHMDRVGSGRIVNITSLGGKIAVPHLLPYTVSKFAMVGLSDGLRAELRGRNIRVTTVCPGLMRTGSPVNAAFKGRYTKEYAWFTVGASLPLLSVSAESAARQILDACRRGSARLVIGIQARGALLLNELFPQAFAALSAIVNRLMPTPVEDRNEIPHPGHLSQSALAPKWLTRSTQKAALANNEL